MPRKKVAIALGGAASRAVIYFGILDVFKEHNIPIDYISACSSSTMIACSYACGTLDKLRARLSDLKNGELFFKIFEPSFSGGVFSLNKIDDYLRPFITVENIEDLPIPAAIVAVDLVHGDEVIFTMGNIFRAIRASCTVPGIFEPIVWGERVLLDGGIMNIIPVEAARRSGADIIIGMDLSTTERIFPDNLLAMKRGYNFLTTPLRYITYWKDRFREKFWPKDDEMHIDQVRVPNIFRVLDKALDYAMTERRRGEYYNCDIIIRPDLHGFGDINKLRQLSDRMYEEGRRAALVALPRIKDLLKE